MAHTHLQTEPDVVATSGGNVAGTAGDWQSWSTTCATAFGDASDAARNFTFGSALSSYASEWNPTIARLAGEVDALGGNVTAAAVTVEHGDADGAQLVTAQHHTAGQQSTHLTRPINFV